MLSRSSPARTVQGLEREAADAASHIARRGTLTSACGACHDTSCRCASPGQATGARREGSLSAAPIPAPTRRAFESRFGYDFGAVRIHTDSAASASAERLGARAYTEGPHIRFAAGEYAPHTAPGTQLLAHELAHVVQQGAARPLAGAATRLPLTRVGHRMVQRMEASGAHGPPPAHAGAGLATTASGELSQALAPGLQGKDGEDDPCPNFTRNAIARLLGFHHIRTREGPDKADRLTFLSCKPSHCFMEFASGAGAWVGFQKYPYYLLAATLYKPVVKCSYDFKCDGTSIRFGPGSCPYK